MDIAEGETPSDLPNYTRSAPASEHESMVGEKNPEDEKTVWLRTLSRLEARINGKAVPIPLQMLMDSPSADESQADKPGEEGVDIERTPQNKYAGLSFVGMTASLRGRHRLKAMCGWYDDSFDWIWVEIQEVTKIEVREDARFRGGAACVWLTTPLGEYALTTAFASYIDQWESTLRHLNSPMCDDWPKGGTRPDWWPAKWARAWPYEKPIEKQYKAMIVNDPLALMAQNLSIQPSTPHPTWRRRGLKGDIQLPGRPTCLLTQLQEWEIDPDAGLRKTLGWNDELDDVQGGTASSKGRGKRAASATTRGWKRSRKALPE